MREIERIVIASRNPAKVNYYRDVLVGVVDEVLGLSDLEVEGKPSEIGETAEENAEIKAKYYAQKTGKTVFCEDEALYVDFLPKDKQPGTRVRRINGIDEVDDEVLISHWEDIVSKVPEEKKNRLLAHCIFPSFS